MEGVLLGRPALPESRATVGFAKPTHRADVQGLRATAVLVVVMYHAGLGMSGGFVGVDMFFVISGFVITRQLVWERTTFGRLDLRRFFLRRIRRILPALSLTVSITILATVFLGPLSVFTDARNTALAAVLVNANNQLGGVLGSNDGDYFTPISELNPFLHTWSLSVEEQFYLVFPFVVAAAGWLGSRRRRPRARAWILGSLLGIVCVSFLLSIALIGSAPELAFYLSPLRAWEFGVGALLIPIDGLRRSSKLVATTLGAVGVGLIAGAVFLYDDGTTFPGVAAAVPVVGTGLLLLAGAWSPNPVSRILSTGPAGFLGDVSYSWYLWHWPLLVFAAATFRFSQPAVLGAVVGSLGLAVVSTLRFENPIRFATRTPAETLRLAAACLLVPVAALAVASSLRPALMASEPIQEFNGIFAPHLAEAETCERVVATNSACTWTVEGSVGSAVLIGDSNAHHFVEGFVAGMNEREYDATLTYSPGCTFTALDMYAWGDDRSHCAEFYEAAMRDLERRPHDLVVVATAVDRYVEDDQVQLRASTTAGFEVTPDGKARLLAEAYTSSFSSLAGIEAEVVFIRSIPELRDWYPHECSALTWIADATDCGFSIGRDELAAYTARGSDVEQLALDESGLRSLDFTEVLCELDRCAAEVNGEWRWKDAGHLTVGQSLELSSWFAALAPS